jgi:hypothetical protein
MPDSSEQSYRDGVQQWAAGDLDGAARLLGVALASSAGPEVDPWWHSASRAMAQVATERDDLDLADRHLVRMPDMPISAAQTMALRGLVAARRGDVDRAGLELSHAVRLVQLDGERDIGSLMNGAIALTVAAEVLVDLGFGHEAFRLVEMARARTRVADVDDATLGAWLLQVEAGARRLDGDLGGASVALDAVDTSLSYDLPIKTRRERARLAWSAGALDDARAAYRAAFDRARDVGAAALARVIEAEAAGGPPVAKVTPEPIERWVELRMGAHLPSAEPEQHLAYAVVVTLAADGDLERFHLLDEQVCALLDQRPDLGFVDGTGTDGDVWQLFLDGDDADELWRAVQPLIAAFGPSPGSHVVLNPLGGEGRELPLA